MKRFVAVVVVLCLLAVTAAYAQFIGHTVTLEGRYPDANTVKYRYGTRLVPSQGAYFNTGKAQVRVQSQQITVTLTPLSGNYTFKTATFNGFNISPADGTTPPLTNVTIDPNTRQPGFDSSRLTWGPAFVRINLQGLTLTPTTRVILNLSF